jgi:hypothetical protein
MATETIIREEAAPTLSLPAQVLQESITPSSEYGAKKSEEAHDKPKVRRVLDEEGGTTTATVRIT